MSARQVELIELAESLIENFGLEAFSLGNLAKKANIRTPSLYKHFSSLMELEHIIISRGFLRFAKDLNHVIETAASDSDEDNIAALAAAYRAHALAHPQIYRLMTERPLDRALLIPGSELAAMDALLQYFDETPEQHDRARAAWAAAHGLVSLEISGRFPPGANIAGAWGVFIEAFSR
ncbi:MAG: TetR/AcrR family transcriptional regulator [Actinomycetales bacterium]|nr:TetR/AcrR family transcriptional regulator [Actinomycetales bacterium]